MRVMDFLLLWFLGRGQDRFPLLFGIPAVYIPLWGERTVNEIERKERINWGERLVDPRRRPVSEKLY
jgi:hypothetical protein